MRPDPANVWKAHGIAVETDAGNRSRRIGSVFYASGPYACSVVKVSATIGRSRMNQDNGIASIELLDYRPICGIPQPSVVIACHQSNTVGADLIVGVFDLL